MFSLFKYVVVYETTGYNGSEKYMGQYFTFKGATKVAGRLFAEGYPNARVVPKLTL